MIQLKIVYLFKIKKYPPKKFPYCFFYLLKHGQTRILNTESYCKPNQGRYLFNLIFIFRMLMSLTSFPPLPFFFFKKAKGLQKLKWYCQMCQKQCRDENGYQVCVDFFFRFI